MSHKYIFSCSISLEKAAPEIYSLAKTVNEMSRGEQVLPTRYPIVAELTAERELTEEEQQKIADVFLEKGKQDFPEDDFQFHSITKKE